MDVEETDDAGILRLHGELDLASSGELEAELERLVGSGARPVIVDLRALEFMDSTGLSVLIKAHYRAEQSGARLVLVKGPPQVQRLLELTGVADRVTLADTPEQAQTGADSSPG